MLKTLFLLSFLVLGVAVADEIEDAIVRDLDFFMALEVLENEELAKNWAKFDEEEKKGEQHDKKSR